MPFFFRGISCWLRNTLRPRPRVRQTAGLAGCWRVGQARGKARMPDWVGIYLPLSRGASLEQSLPCRQPRAAVAKLAGHRGINGAPGLMRQQCRWLASCESLSVCRSRAVQLTAMDARACCLVPNSSLSQQLPPRCASHEKNHAACWLHFRRWFCSK